MKKIFLALSCFSLLVSCFFVDGYSQVGIGFGSGGFGMGMRVPLNNNRRRSETIENNVQRMKKDLNLNDDQVVKVRSLLVERDRRKNGKEPMKGQEFDQRVQEILTPEQYSRFNEIREQRRQQGQQRGQQRSPQQNEKSAPAPEPNKDWDDVYK